MTGDVHPGTSTWAMRHEPRTPRPPIAFEYPDGRTAIAHPGAAGTMDSEAEEMWQVADIVAGLPQIGPETTGHFIPQMLNLDLLDAISFTKGCYTGQEIVARTQNLGRIKRRTFRYAIRGDEAPAPLTALHLDGAKVGEVLMGARTGGGIEVLAVIALDARDRPLRTATGHTAVPLPLPYYRLRPGQRTHQKVRSLLRPQVREQQDVANRWLVGEQHHHPVDPDAETGGRRHAVFERADIVGVEEHRLLIARTLARRLLAKPRGLVVRIVELRETVGELASADEELEAVGDERIAVVASREWRDLGRVRIHEGRLQQAVLGGVLEDLDLQLAGAILWTRIDAESCAYLAEVRDVTQLRAVDAGIEVHDQVLDRDAPECLAEVVGLALPYRPDACRAACRASPGTSARRGP